MEPILLFALSQIQLWEIQFWFEQYGVLFPFSTEFELEKNLILFYQSPKSESYLKQYFIPFHPTIFNVSVYLPPTKWMQGKVTNFESTVSVHYTTLLGHVSMIMMSCFNTDFASQMKLAKHPLIHCIRHWNEREFGSSLGQDVKLYVLEDTSEI